MIKNIVVTIALLAAVPYAFREAYYLQGVIVKNNIIPKLILGASNEKYLSDQDSREKAANELSTFTFLAFVSPSKRLVGCTKETGNSISEECVSDLNKRGKKLGNDYKNALESGDLNYIFSSTYKNESYAGTEGESVNYSEKQFYLLDYNYLLSTIAGGYLCFILIGFCLDVGVRIIKLGFLQLIAPIPILMNISPGKKSGNSLSNWGKECVSTWASLFIRIAVISFAVFFVSQINQAGGIFSFIGSGTSNNLFVKLFIVFGILLFAKEFPKLLEDILGIKGSGKLTLNPLKKLKTDMVGAGVIGGATAGLLGGGLGGAIRGAWSGRNAKDFSEGAKKASDRNNTLRQAKLDGSTTLGRAAARYNKFTGANIGEAGRLTREKNELDGRIKRQETEIKNIDDRMSVSKQEASERKMFSDSIGKMKSTAVDDIKNNKAGAVSERYKELVAEAAKMEQDYKDGKLNVAAGRAYNSEDVRKAQQEAEKYLYKTGADIYIDDVISSGTQGKLLDEYKQYTAMAGTDMGTRLGITAATTANDLRSQADVQEREIANINARNQANELAKRTATAEKQRSEAEKARLYEREQRLKANQDAIK